MTDKMCTFKTQWCECGQLLLIIQPENKYHFEKLYMASHDISVIALEGESAACPICGKLYELPPAETFDIERTPWGQLLSDLIPGRNGEE